MNKGIIIIITIFVLVVGAFILYVRNQTKQIDWSKQKKIKDPLKKFKGVR